MATNKTFSVKNGIDVANTIIVSNQSGTLNVSNISTLNTSTVNAANYYTSAGLDVTGQANAAYAAANAAANTVRVSQNGNSTINAANGLNFVNTSTVLATVSAGINGNANVSFTITNAAQGTQGAQGITGSTGYQGTTGSTGTQGAMGSAGSQGTQGSTGQTGSTGSQGVQGYTGTQGIQGIQGVQGAQGFGLQGLQGAQGTQGSQGIQGPQGTQGVQGFQGLQGSQGIQGAQGIQGFQGTQGQTGPIGGSNTQIVYNNNGTASGSANLTFNLASNTLSVGNAFSVNVTSNTANANVINAVSYVTSAGVDLYTLGNTAANIANTKVYTFDQTTPPLTANANDQWVNSNSGIMYVNANTVNPPVWVEFGPVGVPVTNTFTTQYITATTYAASNADFYIGMNCTSNSIVTLPLANNGTMIVVKDESGNAGVNCNVAVVPSGGDLIDGQNKVTININYGSLTFIYRNGWRII